MVKKMTEEKRKPIHDLDRDRVWEIYSIRVRFRDRVMGGIPADPEILEGHLARKGLSPVEQETANKMLEKTAEMTTVEGATSVSTNIFYIDDRGIFLNDYQVIGCLKEAMQTQKLITSWRSKIQNGVRVRPSKIYLMRNGSPIQEWDGFEQTPVHTEYMGRPMTSIKRMAYIENPVFDADIWVVKDNSKKGEGTPIISETNMRMLLQQMEEIGLGAMRRMGYGKFDAEWRD